jgi:hypothetical protein
MDSLLKLPRSVEMEARYGREALKEELRKAIAAGEAEPQKLLSTSSESLERRFAPTLTEAINGTGVLLHATSAGLRFPRRPGGLSKRSCPVIRRWSTT